MSVGKTEEEYSAVSKALHWATALLIFGLVLVGLFMGDLPASPEKFQIYGLHKSFGLVVLIFVIFRLLWRFISPAPDALKTQAHWEHLLAKIVQFVLYLLMLGLPLSGVLMSNAGGHPVVFFGIDVPVLIEKDKAVFNIMREAHEVFAFGLLTALGLHIAGAFKHFALDKDTTMARMMFSKSPVSALLIFGLTVLFFGGAGYLLIGKEKEEASRQMQQSAEKQDSQIDFDEIGKHSWAIVPEESTLEFQTAMNGVPFTGQFQNFEGNIIFNPEDLKGSKAFVRIDMGSAVTQNDERDEQIISTDWFDVETHPQAQFETIIIEKAQGNHYIAVGNLSLRGVSLPVSMPFTLDIETGKDGIKTAHMMGTLELNRLDFGIGQGEWANAKSVDTSVKVNISLTALQPPR